MANFTLTAGADIWAPGVTADLLTGLVANIGPADDIDMGTGLAEDVFRLTSAGTVDFRTGGNAAGIRGLERLEIAAGVSTIFLSASLVAQSFAGTAKAGQFAVLSNGGSDTVDASAVGATGRITFVAGGGADTFIGGSGNDFVRFNAVDLTSADSVNGGAGSDTLRIDTAGVMAATALTNVRRIETLELAAGGNTVTITQAMAASADGGILAVVSRGGNDRVSAVGVTTQVNYFAGAGTEVYQGGAGIDRVLVTPTTLSAADIMVGGGGSAIDMLRITAGGTFAPDALAGVSGFERIVFSAAGNTITLRDSVFAGVFGTLGLVGDVGNDTVLAGATTRAVWFDPGNGNDRFEGGSGNDSLIIGPAFLNTGDDFNGGLGFDRLTLKTAGAIDQASEAIINGFEEIVLAAGGNTLFPFVQDIPFAVIGGAGADDVYLLRATDTARLGGGNDILRVVAGLNGVVADGGAGVDLIGLLRFDEVPHVVGPGMTGFERVVSAFGDPFTVSFTGPAQSWEVDGSEFADDVTTGTGTYDLQLLGGADTYRIGDSRLNTVQDSGLDADQLIVDSSIALVFADLGAGFDTYTILAADRVVITDAGGNDRLIADATQSGTDIFAQLGTGNDTATLASRANWFVDMGDGADLLTLRAVAAGQGAGALLRGGAGTDSLVLDGPGWGAVTLDVRNEDQLSGNDGGAVQTGFEQFNLSAAASATAYVRESNDVTLTDGDDQLFLTEMTFTQGDGRGGTDTVTLLQGIGNLTWNLNHFDNFEIFVGSEQADSINGDAENEIIRGGGGDDYIAGNMGADTLTGGAGSDRFSLTFLTFAGDTITDFDTVADANGRDTLELGTQGGLSVQNGANGSIVLDSGVFFPGGASMILVTTTLANAAAVDSYLSGRPFAPTGGIYLAAPTSAGGPVAVWYDPSALLAGGVNAPTQMVTLANVTSVAALLGSVDLI